MCLFCPFKEEKKTILFPKNVNVKRLLCKLLYRSSPFCPPLPPYPYYPNTPITPYSLDKNKKNFKLFENHAVFIPRGERKKTNKKLGVKYLDK